MFECAFEPRGERAIEFAFEARDGNRSPANFLLKIPFLLIVEDAHRALDDARRREDGLSLASSRRSILRAVVIGIRLGFQLGKLEM